MTFIDAGFEERTNDDPAQFRRIRDSATGQPVAVPYPLHNGVKGDPDDPDYLQFEVRKTTSFGAIF